MKKHLIPFLMLLLFSATIHAQNDFDSLWIEVEKLEVDNLQKSSVAIVDKIYAKAAKEQNSPQLIKSLFYKSKFMLVLEEDAQLKIIENFKKHISKSTFPTKNILQNILANLYWQYFNQNRYQFYNRTKTEHKVDETDFRTWDLNTLFKEINIQYTASLENATLLQKETIDDFAAILQIQKESKTYRPTLYDFLANQALGFYKSSETAITRPSYKFVLDNPDFLSDYRTFSKIKLQSKDSLSLQFNALKIYQDLIQFHTKHNHINALVDIDIQRILFVYQNATFRDKESYFLNTLKSSKEYFNTNEMSGLYAFEIAKIHREKSQNKEAISICNGVINQFPESKAAINCSILKSQIEEKSLQIQAEKFIPIQTKSRILVTYKNIDSLFFTAYKITSAQSIEFNLLYEFEEQVKFINSLEKVETWKASLRNEGDYLEHSTEIIVPKFDAGSYLLIASEHENLKEEHIFGSTSVQVTNVTLIENDFGKRHNYQIVDRNNGKPIENAIIHLNNEGRKYGAEINKKLTTDSNGFASIESTAFYPDTDITVRTKNDFVSFGNRYLSTYRDSNENDDEIILKPFIFTDRSIYRPGQIVYFKVIVIKKQGEKTEVLKDEYVEIILYDANNQEVKTLDVKLNEFGSVAGEFILPNNGLTGEFHIKVDESSEHDSKFYDNQDFDFEYNSTSFSVEEYKRPTFETEFKPITESFKINDSISVKGFAKTFSGANVTDAKVVYRVQRKVIFPNWYYRYRPNLNATSQEITNGESSTNDKGEFEIVFTAIPDETVDKKSLPVFNYEITADITDINGETRSATRIVKVGYHSLIATISLDDKIDKNQKETTIQIDTKNLNDEFVAAKGNLTIYKLQAPKNPLRIRPWSAPDYQDISENTFRNLFPNDPFTDDEADEKNWKKGLVVFSADFDTKTSKEIKLNNLKNWVSGEYVVIVESKDKFGQEVKDEKRFSLFSSKEKTVADKKLFTINTDKAFYKIGDEVEIQIASASKDMTVVVQIEKESKIVDTYLVKLNNSLKTIKVPVKTEDLGGFAIKYHFVNFNYFESGNLLISVPEKQESIAIETNIFRDKLQPGQEETWSFTIKNDKNNAITAEVLASMYDASLDEFTSHNWQFNPILSKSSYQSYTTSNASHSFGNSYFYIQNNQRRYYDFPRIAYNEYNWFGFSLNENRYQNKLYLRNVKQKINSIRTDFDGTITGVVEGENGTLPGVSITIKGTTFRTQTDFDGNYSIKVKKGDVLEFRYLGFKSIDFSINNQSTLNVLLEEDSSSLDEVVMVGYGIVEKKSFTGITNEVVIETKEAEEKLDKELSKVKARNNFKETAFFFPQLRTDKNGQVSFSFTMPEALTRWKLQLLAHTTEVKSATKTLQTVTQKELMVTPNAPRFLREKDTITFSAKITNLTNNQLSGFAKLILTDAISGKDITQDLLSKSGSLPLGEMLQSDKVGFVVDKDGNSSVSWNLSIPETVQAVQYKIVAKAGDFSDGEQHVLPILTNRMLVTETMPMWVRSNETKTFTLDKLKNNTSSTLKNHQLTLEMTSNPVWVAIQALPYLMEYPYECAEQTFSKYYANTLASFLANSNPKIQQVFDAWKSSDALLSNLEKNQELKSLMIQETPWLRDAQSETEQKKRIALLFDLNKMKNEQEKSISKLKDFQMSSGGFPWFKGSETPNVFISQHIATGFGHLQKLGVTNLDDATKNMIQKTVTFLDAELLDTYNKLVENAKKASYQPKNKKEEKKQFDAYLAKNNLSYFIIQYLYMRSFYTDIAMNTDLKNAVSYYQNQSISYWNDYNLYAKGQMALSLFRNDKKPEANKIVKSLKENAIISDELGMYWKSNIAGYWYYQAPVETQALMIEVFSEILDPDIHQNKWKLVDNLKIWLLKNKQTNQWKTTKATTEAVYALLMSGSDFMAVNEQVNIKIGEQEIIPTKLENVRVEAGSGYFKTSWHSSEIKKEMAAVTISKKENGIAWGGLYWQYFEDLDKITSAETPLKLSKKLFLKINADTGKELQEINQNTKVKIGDLITVRIELRSDRDMEFIHMKDMRAAGLEPINVLSKYKWQDNLGYYESTKDASTNFFFDRIPKGVYVFEYDVRVNNAGNFSNGITTIQSMYAPEFSSHSTGERIHVSEK